MSFVPPDWFTGMLTYGFVFILPILLGIGIIVLGVFKDNRFLPIIGIIVMLLAVPTSMFITHEMYEVPSIQETNITVQEWQPKPNLEVSENGMMVVNSADDLLLVTTDGQGFVNEENFWFQKFNTRDIFNQLKVNGTYTIKYYGWREGFNSGFPNILSIEKVIDENNTSENNYNDYFGNIIVSK